MKKVIYVILQHSGEYEEAVTFPTGEAYTTKPEALQRASQLEKENPDDFFTIEKVIVQ